MNPRAGAIVGLILLALAPAAGCASPPKELARVSSLDQEERIEAANGLAAGVRAGEPDYLERRADIAQALRALLDDKSALVRQVAVETLAEVEGRGAAGPIADRLRDADPWVRYAAAKALGRIEARTAAEPLARALREDQSADVRRAAAQSLGALKPRSALRDLYLALQDEPGVRHQAYRALVAITGEDHGEDPRGWRERIPLAAEDRPPGGAAPAPPPRGP